MTFLKALKNETNITETENMAKAYKSTESAVLDLFSLAGAARNMEDEVLVRKVIHALDEDFILATKVVFYIGDIRGGQGERRFFRLALPYILEHLHPDQARNVLSLVPNFSRWDIVVDMYAMNVKGAKSFLINAIKEAKNGLIYKWLPSEKKHGRVDPLARQLAKDLGLTPREYRKMLVEGRKNLNLVETNLTNKEYEKINYSRVPSIAGLKYKKAFVRNDGERYSQYIQDVLAGKEKINVSVLYPHDIVHKYTEARGYWHSYVEEDPSLEAMWKNLPDFLKNDNSNTIVLADSSGSMQTRIGRDTSVTAHNVSISLAVYFAERLKGEFKNHFITFSERPVFQKLAGSSLSSKIQSIEMINASNTNLQSAFDLILETGIKNKVSKEDMPNSILVISDMQFDYASPHQTNFELIREKYEEAGYNMPLIIFWNVCARLENTPAKMNDQNTVLVSGYSPSVIKFIFSGEVETPYEFMLKVLSSPRYEIFDSIIEFE